jgi:NAD-dependent DNA ligase
MQTLLGICTGICADDFISDREIHFLKTWLNENENVGQYWPGSTITKRVTDILSDGKISEEEKQDFLHLLLEITGTHFAETGSAAPESPALPIDDDPSIYIRNMSFCFTGRFYFGTRAACERAILKLGGIAVDNVSSKLNYLVIGGLIEPSWAHTTYGRKIESATKHQQSGADLLIVSEHQWTQAIADSHQI